MKRPEVVSTTQKLEKYAADARAGLDEALESDLAKGLKKGINAAGAKSEKLAQKLMTPKNIVKIVAGSVLAVLPITAVAEYRKATKNTELLDIIAAEEQQIIGDTIMESDRAAVKQKIRVCDRADFMCESDANQAQLESTGLDAVNQELTILPDTVRACREQQLECLRGIGR